MVRLLTTISCLLAIFLSLQLRAQPNLNGVPIITNYPYSITGGTEQNWCITQDHRGVLYVGNNDKGILEYDGVNWRVIPVQHDATVLSLVTGDDGVIYAGLDGDFGRLEPDSIGNIFYNSLLDSTLREKYDYFGIWRSYFEKGKVYFCSVSQIFVFNPEDQSIEVSHLPGQSFFTYYVDQELYTADYWERGLMVLQDTTFKTVAGGRFFKEMNISGMQAFGKDKILISTYYNGLFILDRKAGRVIKDFIDQDLMKELSEAQITFLNIEGEQILLGTFFKGLYILDMEGKVKQIVAKSEELKDKTISHVYSNQQLKGGGPLWIAHWKGISKLETNNPFKKFTEAAGFEGLITDIEEFNGTLYISTMSGLYYRKTSSEGTRFILNEDVQGEIYDLQVINPGKRLSFLLAASRVSSYVINRNGQASNISDSFIPLNEDAEPLINGRKIIKDPSNDKVFFTGGDVLVGLEYYRGKWKEIYQLPDLGDEIYSMAMDRYGYLWLTTLADVQRVDVSLSQEATRIEYTESDGLPPLGGNYIFSLSPDQEIRLGTRFGFYAFDYFNERFYPDSALNAMLPPGKNRIRTMHVDRDGDYWLSFDNEFRGWTELLLKKTEDDYEIVAEKPFQRLSSAALVDVFQDDSEKGGVWFSKSDELYYYDKEFYRNDSLPFNALIRKVSVNGDSILFQGTNFIKDNHGTYHIHENQEVINSHILDHRYNNIEFQWAAPYFEQEERLQYSFRLNGFNSSWSAWNEASSQPFTNLKHGRYKLEVKARNVYGYESQSAFYSFVIRRPWYASIVAIILYIILGGLFIYLAIKLYTLRLKRENLRLEGIIQERTAEITKQKEELTDSIQYASRIQHALLPSAQLLEKHQLEHFILFRPRDIVSGDFYWIGEKKGKLMVVAADCTGHGVPGAFMSMLGMTFLDEIVINSGITDTAKILGSLREHVITSLEQSHVESHDAVKDGMDLAMLSIDMKTHAVQYSGAYNPLYMVRKLNAREKKMIEKGEELDIPRGSIYDSEYLLIQVRADQMPIGISEKDHAFHSSKIPDEGYSFYIFSDGFVDQFGGVKGKKFMSRNFKKLVLELQKIPISEQGAALEKILLDWMGDISQIDDILVMGLRLKEN